MQIKTLFLLFVLFAIILPFFEADNVNATDVDSWTAKSPLQQERAGLGVAVVNGKIYAIGGSPRSSQSTIDVTEEYDPVTDTWVFKEPMPTARESFAIATYYNKIYCIGGKQTNVTFENGVWVSSESFILGVNEVYDPETDSWQLKSPLPVTNLGITASVVGDKIYVVGGDQSNELWVYDPKMDSWSSKASVPVSLTLVGGVWSCTSVALEDRLHVIGAFPLANSHLIYDPKNDSWTFSAPVISGYYYAIAGATSGEFSAKRIYVYGVSSQWWDLVTPEVYGQSYDPTTGNWTECLPMSTGRINAGIAVLNDIIYLIGGATPAIGNNLVYSAANEQYTPIDYVPEFSTVVLLSLFLITIFLVVLYKKEISKKSNINVCKTTKM